MQLKIKILSIIIFFNVFTIQLYSQSGEVVVPLINNPSISKIVKEKPSFKKGTLTLPFFDDFSYISQYGYDSTSKGIFPFDTLWDDRLVYINSTMPILPPTIGVATFDGLNSQGEPYLPDAFEKGQPADTLTSKPIDLSTLDIKDTSLYLSFYYQPQGNGDAPEFEDSISVQALDKNGKWKLLWHKSETSLKPFRLAIINLHPKDSFYHENFRFRFLANASLTGNLDHWHIDYVYLNIGRTKNDTSFKDQSFVYLPKSLLKDYTSIPARHFYRSTKQRDLFQTNHSSLVKNNLNLVVSPNYRYEVKDYLSGKLFINIPSSSSTTQQINPNDTLSFKLKLKELADLNLLNNQDTIKFLTKDILIPQFQADETPRNDFSFRVQSLTNFYAYDDGSAEKGYGLINAAAGKVALRFNAISQDSIQGVLIRFNRSKEKVDTKKFKLLIWERITPALTTPLDDKVIYQSEFMTPIYNDGYEGFTYLPLDKRVSIKSGDFYIGWYQEDKFILNVGLDANYEEFLSADSKGTKRNPNLFYITETSWKQTSYPYTLMMRPVMGPVPFVGVENQTPLKNEEILAYPNPSTGLFQIAGLESNSLVLLTDISGKLISQNQIINSSVLKLDLSNHPKGIYLLKVVSQNGKISNSKLILE